MAMPAGMADLLARKYMILQQQADATTKNAATGALVGAAGARLDNTRASLLPGQAAAEIAKLGADTLLTKEQTKIVLPESQARVRNLNANTGLTQAETSLTGERTIGERQLNRVFKVNPDAPAFFTRNRFAQ
jgi:hypothetical protein